MTLLILLELQRAFFSQISTRAPTYPTIRNKVIRTVPSFSYLAPRVAWKLGTEFCRRLRTEIDTLKHNHRFIAWIFLDVKFFEEKKQESRFTTSQPDPRYIPRLLHH